MSKKEKEKKEDNLYTVKETADFLKISTSLVYKLIKQKQIPYTKISGKYLFQKDNLQNWMNSLTNI
jgi:excisionase family DNA binding protein